MAMSVSSKSILCFAIQSPGGAQPAQFFFASTTNDGEGAQKQSEDELTVGFLSLGGLLVVAAECMRSECSDCLLHASHHVPKIAPMSLSCRNRMTRNAASHLQYTFPGPERRVRKFEGEVKRHRVVTPIHGIESSDVIRNLNCSLIAVLQGSCCCLLYFCPRCKVVQI